MKKQILSALALLLAAFSFAQVPQAFKYQSIVRNSLGSPMVSAAVTVRATIHNDSAAGTVEYQETQAITTNQFGLINIEIGKGIVVIGTFSSIPWGIGSKWMQIEADFGAGYLPMGTSQLLSVPYALCSANGPIGDSGARGPKGDTGIHGIVGDTGVRGAKGDTGVAGTNGSALGLAEYICSIQAPNISVPPGTAFFAGTTVINTSESGVTATANNGGTVFQLATGTYAIDYEMSLASSGSVALYTGATYGSMVIDNTTITGSSTSTTWIHGRAFKNVASSPFYFEVSSVVGTADVTTAGSAAGEYVVRITIIKIF